MSVVRFPSRHRGAERPASSEALVIDRRPVNDAADWQQDIRAECRRLRALSPSVFAYLKTTGLLFRCTFLASEGRGQPLLFRYIGAPTLAFLGRSWARQQLGKPDMEDPHHTLAEGVGAQYHEAIDGAEAVFNQVIITGLSAAPKVYTHLLVGWQDGTGRRALLSCLDAA